MIKLKLHTNWYGEKKPLTIYVNGSLTLTPVTREESRTPNTKTCVQDGLHNNGGWMVLESIEEIEKMIDYQLKPNSNEV